MAADTSYPNGFQVRQDGNAVVPTGKSLDVESGGLFKIAGTTVTATAAEVNKLTGNSVSASDLTKLHDLTPTAAALNKMEGATGTPVVAKRGNFSETAGAGTYTWSMTLPANAVLVDIIVHATALWAAATSATMKIGDAADDDGFFVGVNLKATDLLAGESLSFAQAGGKEGAYIANSQVSKRRDASERVLSAIVTTVGETGNTGSTSVTVVYSLPVSGDITSATKA